LNYTPEKIVKRFLKPTFFPMSPPDQQALGTWMNDRFENVDDNLFGTMDEREFEKLSKIRFRKVDDKLGEKLRTGDWIWEHG